MAIASASPSRRPIRRTAAQPSEPVPQSLRQQELVCLTSGHVNCPRYMRGAMTSTKPLDRVPAARIVTPGDRRVGPGPGRCLPAVGRVRRRQRRPGADGGRSGGPTGAVLGEVDDRRADGDDRGRDAARIATAAATAAPTPSPTPRPRARRPRRARPRSPTAAAQLRPPPRHRPPSPDGQAVLEPVRAAQALLGHARVLRLRGPLGRQPVQHRQLLRGPLEDRQGLEPLDGGRPQGRPRAADPATHPLSRRRRPYA